MKIQFIKTDFCALVQDFFCQYLMNQRNSSARTVAAYRDTFRLLFEYLRERRNIQPASIALEHLDATTVLGFLDYLEAERLNSVRSRNARLAAIRSFLNYVAPKTPDLLPTIQQVLAIPMKRFMRPVPQYLSPQEVQAILDATNTSTWSGRRDRVLLATLYNTGARVSEVIGLRVSDVDLTHSMSVTIQGKGRKQRVVPLWKSTVKQLRQWLRHLSGDAESPLFPNSRGQHLTRSGVANRLKKTVRVAATRCPTLNKGHVSPHVLRHTTAMHLLQAGVDLTVIALWLGHESPVTTHMYVEADLSMKENALRKIAEPAYRQTRYKASSKLLQFLESL
jgi:integrase/recombinase XerD